jgi:transcriptional regulator with XRE-family HTH domain
MNRKHQIELICAFLKSWRKSRGLSQEQVQIATGVDVSHYDKCRCEPGLYNLLILCDFYGISFSWLLALAENVVTGLVSEEEFMSKSNGGS